MKLAEDYKLLHWIFFPVIVIVLFSSCASSKRYSGFTFVRKYQKNIPFVYKNNISLDAEGASKDEKTVMKARLATQLEDSARVRIKDAIFILHYIKNPPVFDTFNVQESANNMASYMRNIGYYDPSVSYSFDTLYKKVRQQQRVIINYKVSSGKRTTIDTVAYLFNQPELQQIAISTRKQSQLQKGVPITKVGITDEVNRLVGLFRNFGYYKFTSDEIRVTGDTTIEALTTVSEDPFEQLRLLAEAAAKREKPTIRIAFQLNDPGRKDSLKKYYVDSIIVMPDFEPGESYTDSSLQTSTLKKFTIKFHEKKFKSSLIDRNLFLKQGKVFRQEDYFKTINGLFGLGIWENPNIDILERKDTALLNLIIKLVPQKKYGFQGNIEMSYSANSNTSNLPSVSTGNLLGLSANLSLTDRNFANSAVRMSNSVKMGLEFNTDRRNTGGTFINSRELSFNNSFIFPKFIFPLSAVNQGNWLTHQSVISNNLSFINRIDFYNQQVIGTSYGFNFSKAQNRMWTVKLFNFDFHRLFNRSARFDSTIQEFPFLRYSFNTALVMGSGMSYSVAYPSFKNKNVVNKILFNLEESGLLWGFLKKKNVSSEKGNFFNKYLREFVKADLDYTRSYNHPKSAFVLHGFIGVGIPISKSDTTLPFFKQFFGGGPNSMRGWPVQGIGLGGQPLAPYLINGIRFNDRTGDIQIEGNAEYRFNVAPLFSNAVLFKMALFTDIGNVWNFKNTRPDGLPDTTQFQFKNLYKQLGVSSGVGFRFDFTYFLLRFDVAFKFKRPDLWTDHAGWQIPNINFKNLFSSDIASRIWRYQNFNATIGIDYPF
ncbi:MAG: BamA/TamA family outer membrane protein [Chitinophagaceae bacterium]|nr:BamA/TamA family outer membrane protein [Chitinophagaceae bacterium]